MITLWWNEAGRNGVLPLDDRRGGALFKSAQFRGNTARRNHFVFYPPVSRYSSDVAPPTGNRSFAISADFTLGATRQGTIVARGSANGGYVLFVQDGHLVFDYNFFHTHSQVRSAIAVPNGPCVAGVRVDRVAKTGRATLFIDGVDAGSVDVPEMVAMVSSTGMDVGRSMAPVCHDYQPPFVFDGELRRVTFEIATSRPPQVRSEALTAERVTMGLQ